LTANACLGNGGRVAIEWPRSCLYWRDRKAKADLCRWGCEQNKFDGCMYGLVSQAAATSGKLLRKPWTIASNADGFRHLQRPCDHTHEHVKTQGSDTKLTEGYTEALADEIHHCWALSVDGSGVRSTLATLAVAGERRHLERGVRGTLSTLAVPSE